MQQLIKQKDVLKLIGITQPTLSRYIKKGIFPRPVKLGNTKQAPVFYKLEEVQAFIDSKQI